MDEINKLIQTISESLGYRENDWDSLLTTVSKNEAIFLRLLLQNRELTEIEMATSFLGTEPTNANFRRYKRNITEKLINTIIQFEAKSPDFSNFQKAYYTLHKQLSSFNILRGLGYTDLAYTLAKRLIKKARFYHFTEIGIELSRFLARYYSNNEHQPDKAETYFIEAQQLSVTLNSEILIEKYYSQITSRFIRSKSIKTDIGQEGLKYVQQLRAVVDSQIPSYKFYLYYYRLATHSAEGMGDYNMALEYAERGYEHFEKQNYHNKSAKIIFLSAISSYQIQLGKIDDAKRTIQKTEQLLTPGRTSWFINKKLLIQIAIHNQNYKVAYQNYIDVKSHKNYELLAKDKKNIFQLYGAYLDFLALIRIIPDVPKVSRFRINKFINEVPEFNADKRGMKIPLIIAQLLYYIYDGNYDAIEVRILALKDYCSRNLMKKSPNYRSNCFIKMLLTIPTNNFHPVAARRKTKNLLDKLARVPFQLSQQPSEVEVIPYEHLWEIILNFLKAPRRRRLA